MSGKKKDDESKPVRSEAVVESYRKRLTVLRKAQEFSRADDIPKAVQQYNLYLNSLARFFDVKEEELSPSLFDQDRDITELLLISQVYWDLAKAYDRSPKLALESIRCLNQFAKFTQGFKYQYVNAQMLKKYIRGRLPHNIKAFETAYEKVRVEGKGCYIASCLYGPHAPKTQRLREFRELTLRRSTLGRNFIALYEDLSPRLVDLALNNPLASLLLRVLIAPLVAVAVFLVGSRYDRT